MIWRSLRESLGGVVLVGMYRKLSSVSCRVKEKVRKKTHCVKTRMY